MSVDIYVQFVCLLCLISLDLQCSLMTAIFLKTNVIGFKGIMEGWGMEVCVCVRERAAP